MKYYKVLIGLNGDYLIKARSIKSVPQKAIELFNRQFKTEAKLVTPVYEDGSIHSFDISHLDYIGYGWDYNDVFVHAKSKDKAVIRPF